MSKILRATKLYKSYKSPAPVSVLNGISLEIEEGERVAIMGKSGEGKSTLLHTLGTLEKPCNGEIELCGQKLEESNLAEIRSRKIGFIFQFFHLLDDYTALENVLMPAKIARIPVHKRSETYKRALLLLEQVGLKERAHFPVKLLSGGEKQRVAFARALCNDPPLIFADEPSGNLDNANSQKLHNLLLACVKEHKKTLLVVTHDQDLASLCDRTLLLKDGVLCKS